MNLHQINRSFLILMVLSVCLLCDCTKHPQSERTSKQLICDDIKVEWVNSKLNIFTKGKGSEEGYKKMYIKLKFQNYSNDTLYIPLYSIKNKTYESFFYLTSFERKSKLIDTTILECSTNKNYLVIVPGIIDTIIFKCTLNTFDNDEALIKASNLAGESNMIFASPFPNNFNINGMKVLNSMTIERETTYKLGVVFK
jgi:hypothetical protein